MIDRNIRDTRSEEETKRAKKQGWITVGIFIVIWIIINRIQSFIIKAHNQRRVLGLYAYRSWT